MNDLDYFVNISSFENNFMIKFSYCEFFELNLSGFKQVLMRW